MKKYQWHDSTLEQKYRKYNNITWVLAAVTIGLLFVLPENMKVYNLIPLAFAIGTWVVSLRTQSKDVKIKKASRS